MTITIDTPSEADEAIHQQAGREGLNVQEYILRVVLKEAVPALPGVSTPSLEQVKKRIEAGYYEN